MSEFLRLDKKIEYLPDTSAKIGIGLIATSITTSAILFNLSDKQKIKTNHYFLWIGAFCMLCGGIGFLFFANSSNSIVNICGKPIEVTLAFQVTGVGILFVLGSLLNKIRQLLYMLRKTQTRISAKKSRLNT